MHETSVACSNVWAANDSMDDRTLVAAAQADLQAFGVLYQRYFASVYRYLRARARSDDDAADLTQQVFMQVIAGLPHYRDRGRPFAAWVFRIARNAAIDMQRKHRVALAWDLLPESLQQDNREDTEGVILQGEMRVRLRTLIQELREQDRELIVLRFVARLTVAEIAGVVGKSEWAVRKQLTRTLEKLKGAYDVE